MSSKPSSNLPLTKRTKMVGRQEEVKRLHRCLRARGENHFIYYWARGGLGKTRMLEELQRMVEEAGPGYYSTPIIDLYHTDTHSISDVERAIVEGLDPEQKYFAQYRQEREQYELLRERGTDPGVLERRRETLSQFFIQGCREMALDARKLVICFDTVELLQYASSAVEEIVGPETADTRVKPWLLDKLAQLANVLVVFAGRPMLPVSDEQIDPQARFVTDLERTFGKDLTIVELEPFTFEETKTFVEALTGEAEVIPKQHLPVAHCLTGGRPIFLHLAVDLLQVLSTEPRAILKLFDQYTDLVSAPEGDEGLAKAREQIEMEILRGVFNEAAELGGYLVRMALMPKGVDVETLHQALGLPQDEAEQLLARLEPLSFTKRFKALPGAARLHGERLFFHDEMYRLLTKPGVVPNLRLNERVVAHGLVTNYYDPRIDELGRELAKTRSPEERVPLRERLQKLQVERLYYLLVRDPSLGYEEYKRLSDQANRRRWVGFGMRLLDEFLRFYNTPGRQEQFETAGVLYEQIIRESAQMWVERFHWWGQYDRAIQFARHILDQPDTFFIDPQKNLAILGNACALWCRARAVLHGYEPEVLKEAQTMLDRLPAPVDCTPEQTLTRARLSTSIGYQYRLGGLLAQAAAHYVDANAAFRRLGDYPDELAMVLNSLAFAYAKQGRMSLARPLAHEALRINEEMGSEYSTGLTLSTLASIAQWRGNYPQAVTYGEEALALFRELEDAHGTALAYTKVAQATRRMAKHELEKGRKLEQARHMLEDAGQSLNRALGVAEQAGLESHLKDLRAEQGRVYRELGHLLKQMEGPEEGLANYRLSERALRMALEAAGWGRVDQADTLQDLAETLYASGDETAALQCLEEVAALIGHEHRIVPGEHAPEADLPAEYYAPLGKVEMLRGQMAFDQGQSELGLQHFVLAFAYFVRFSPDAVEKDTMVGYLYKHLRRLSIERQQKVLEAVRTWVHQSDLEVVAGAFLEILESLLGV